MTYGDLALMYYFFPDSGIHANAMVAHVAGIPYGAAGFALVPVASEPVPVASGLVPVASGLVLVESGPARD